MMSAKKILLRIGIGIATFLLLLFITLEVITLVFSGDVKAFVISQLNKQLATEVKVNGAITFSLFNHFPSASITFNDVVIKESLPEKNNLLETKKISLLFNIWHMLHKNYTIEKITAEDGMANIKVDAAGNANYLIFKSDTASSSNFNMKITEAAFKNFKLSYIDEQQQQHSSFQTKLATISGDFSSQRFTLQLKSDMISDFIKSESSTYFPNKKIEINGSIDCDLQKKIYNFQKTTIAIEGNQFQLKGSISPLHENKQYHLEFASASLQLEDIIELLPDQFKKQIATYSASGNITMQIKIDGVKSATADPIITAEFQLQDGSIRSKGTNGAIEKINLTANFTNGKNQNASTSQIDFKTFSATIAEQNIRGSLLIKNFNAPFIDFSVDGKIDLEKLFPFIKSNEIKNIYGAVEFHNCYYHGSVSQIIASSSKGNLNAGGKFDLQNIAIETMQAKYEKLNGSFAIDGNSISFQTCSFTAGKSDLSFSGTTTNVIPFLFSSLDSTKKLQKIGLNVKLTSDVFHWEDLVGNNSDNKNNPKQNSAAGDYSIPQMFYLLVGTVEGTIGDFSYDRFKASSIHGKIIFILNQIYFNDLSMKAEGGTITANGKLNIESPSNSKLELVANLNQLNISQLFFEFNNFGQQMITDKILSGNLTASISLQSIWDDKKLNKEKLHAIADITIEDGELNNFEPMLALSKFIKVNELKDIRFSKMQNQLEVTHQQVIIPSMQIFTNAMNLTLSGTHGFNNIIDYKVQLNLLRLLTDKFRKTSFDPGVTEQSTEGFLNLFLTMKGDASNPVIKYDKQSVKQKINADLAIEKTTLKETLKKEFKKQESIQQQEEKEASDQNQIQFFQFEGDSTNNENE